MNPYKLVTEKIVYSNPWITIHEHKVLRPDGRDGIQAFMETSGGGSVLPILDDKSVFLSKEYKYPVEKFSIEVFSGGRREGEEPIDSLKRELLEELGASAKNWTYLGYIHPFTSFVKSPNHMFIAQDLKFSERNLDEGEFVDIIRLSILDALQLVLDGQITHAASCVLLLRAARMFNV